MEDNILVNNINSLPVEFSFGFLISGHISCLLVTRISDTSSKQKATDCYFSFLYCKDRNLINSLMLENMRGNKRQKKKEENISSFD